MKKKVKINGKVYEVKEVEESTSTEEETEEVAEEEVEEETTPAEEETPDEDVDSKIDEAAEKIMSQLNLDKIHEKLDSLSNSSKEEKTEKKASAVIDLEALMNKDVKEMTSREKILGFFQGAVKNDRAVLKALSEGTDADGGYLFPDEFRAEVIRDIAEQPRMRNEVTVIPMRRDAMNIPTLESRPQVSWTDENAEKSTTTAHFGQVTLTVKKMAAILYASDELIEDSTEIDIVNFVVNLFSEAIGEEEDKVVWQGNGTTQPTGIVTSKDGGNIGTVSCSGNLGVDDLINLIYELPQKYHRNAKIYSHRTNIREMRKLKDDNGNYYWSNPSGPGFPPKFNGYPVIEVNDLPESEIYFGDLKKGYWFGDRKRMTVKTSQDTETALNCEGSINWVNCWEPLKKLGQSAAKLLSKWQLKVQSIEFETAFCRI